MEVAFAEGGEEGGEMFERLLRLGGGVNSLSGPLVLKRKRDGRREGDKIVG